MTEIMAGLYIDVPLSRAELTLFHHGNCFLIASTDSAYCVGQMLQRVIADGSTRSWHNALYDCPNSWIDIEFHRIWDKTNPNMRERFLMSWWNSEVSQSSAANLERFVFHFSQYGFACTSNMVFLCELTIVIPQLPGLFRIAKAVSSTVELVNLVPSDFVNSFNFAMWAFASKCFRIELFPCSDGWRRTWWQMIQMMAGPPVSSILQCKPNCHEDPCLELFQPLGGFEPTFNEAHQTSKMIWKVRSLKSQMETHFVFEDIITSSNEVFNDFHSDMAVRIRKLGNRTRETAELHVTVKQIPGLSTLSLKLQGKRSDL